MLRSLIVILVFALILLPACNKNEEIEVEIPVWAEVQALLPSEVVGEECSLEPPEGKPAVAFYDEKGKELGGLEHVRSIEAPPKFTGWVSNVTYGDKLCIEYGDCKSKLDELQNEAREIDKTRDPNEINGFKVNYGQHHRSGTHVRLAILGDDFYLYCCWEKKANYDFLFLEFIKSIDTETLAATIGQQSGISGQA